MQIFDLLVNVFEKSSSIHSHKPLHHLKLKNNDMWLFKSDDELVIEDSILVDNNKTISTKQIVIKGIINTTKIEKNWSLEKI